MLEPPRIFVSYTHRDKLVVRRLVRELRDYRFDVWIDEAELRLGAMLSAALQAHIEHADVVLVVASAASSTSPGVVIELAPARAHGKTIVPVFVEDVKTHELFRDLLGIDATRPLDFTDSIRALVVALCRSRGLDPPASDPAVMTANLRAVASEHPALGSLIFPCLASGNPDTPSTATLDGEFHALDYALNALVIVKPSAIVATHAAYAFIRVGAGIGALLRWIEATGDGDLPLVTAMSESLRPELQRPALRLLRACNPPNNHALYQFISRNAAQLEDANRSDTMQLVIWPVRGPERLGDVLGRVALEHFADATELVQMWTRWICSGCFDGDPLGPSELARALGIAAERNLPGWAMVNDALRSHVRGLVRSGDRQKVAMAVDHLRAAADENASVLAALVAEMQGVSATAEWEDWRRADKKTADEMRWYLHCFVEQAESGRDWLAAWNSYKQQLAFEEMRAKTLRTERADPEP